MSANVVNIVGGIGNQLFQYLFGVALEYETSRPTLYDVGDFEHYKLHGGLKLEVYFDLKLPIATDVDLSRYSSLLRSYNAKRAVSRYAHILGPMRPWETDRTSGLVEASRHSSARYFRGYWQDEIYDEAILRKARARLQFNAEVDRLAAYALQAMKPDLRRAAAIQVRRGDYLTAPKGAPHYSLPLQYYYRAMDRMADEGVRHFYAFSDDIEGLKLDFSSNHDVTFVGSDLSGSASVDFCLLTHFPNMVISNSTFGWWAAMLRRDLTGKVVTPDPWINPAHRGRQAQMPMMPSHWTSMRV